MPRDYTLPGYKYRPTDLAEIEMKKQRIAAGRQSLGEKQRQLDEDQFYRENLKGVDVTTQEGAQQMKQLATQRGDVAGQLKAQDYQKRALTQARNRFADIYSLKAAKTQEEYDQGMAALEKMGHNLEGIPSEVGKATPYLDRVGFLALGIQGNLNAEIARKKLDAIEKNERRRNMEQESHFALLNELNRRQGKPLEKKLDPNKDYSTLYRAKRDLMNLDQKKLDVQSRKKAEYDLWKTLSKSEEVFDPQKDYKTMINNAKIKRILKKEEGYKEAKKKKMKAFFDLHNKQRELAGQEPVPDSEFDPDYDYMTTFDGKIKLDSAARKQLREENKKRKSDVRGIIEWAATDELTKEVNQDIKTDVEAFYTQLEKDQKQLLEPSVFKRMVRKIKAKVKELNERPGGKKVSFGSVSEDILRKLMKSKEDKKTGKSEKMNVLKEDGQAAEPVAETSERLFDESDPYGWI